MAMAFPSVRSGRRTSRSRSQRRNSSGSTEWVASISYVTMQSDVVNWVAFEIVPNIHVQTMTSPTYLGGHVEVLANVTATAPETSAQGVVALGICVLPQRTLEAALGAALGDPAPIPLPFSDAEGDWPYHRFFYLSGTGADGTLDPRHTNSSLVRFHDVARSKRKLSEDDALVGVAEFVGSVIVPPTGFANLVVTSRVLLRQA